MQFLRSTLALATLAALAGPAGAQNLNVDVPSIPIDVGGTQNLSLSAGGGWAGFLYVLAGTTSGTTPGFSYGGFTIPLNPDPYTWMSILSPASLLNGAAGNLDGSGRAQAAFVLPPCTDPVLVGVVVHHAFAVFDPTSFKLHGVSNAASVTLAVQDSMYVLGCSLGCSSGYCGQPVTCSAATMPASATISVTFSEAVDPASVNLISFQVVELATGVLVPGQVTLQGTDTLDFAPSVSFVAGTSYTVRVPGVIHDPGQLYIRSAGGTSNVASMNCTVLAQ